MEHRDAFSGYHPAVALLYFAAVLILSMFLLHPLCLGISFCSALLYSGSLNGWSSVKKQLSFLLPMSLLMVVINAAFSHAGTTILVYLPSGNALTLESILYGVGAAAMLSTVVLWFSCFHRVMTSDKLMYLFGKGVPALSLTLSMTLRFIPRLQGQLHRISDAQRCIGRGVSDGTLRQRAKNAIAMLSILITWALENAMETADSMKSRGYGLPGRTAFSIYRFDSRDKSALLWLLLSGLSVLSGWASGSFSWRYYPSIKGSPFTVKTFCFLLFYLALCLTPVAMEAYEAMLWKRRAGKLSDSEKGGASCEKGR